MKTVLLQFNLLFDLATFSKTVSDRGYLISVKDLTIRCCLTDAELQTALRQYHARILPLNKAAA